MTIKKICDSVTRKEVLAESVSMCTPMGRTKECERGDIVEAIYSYDCTLNYNENQFDESDFAMIIENFIKSLFIKYGDTCLDLNFLNSKLIKEGFSFIQGNAIVTDVRVAKVYQLLVEKKRGGCTKYQSRTYRLQSENTETQGLTNK